MSARPAAPLLPFTMNTPISIRLKASLSCRRHPVTWATRAVAGFVAGTLLVCAQTALGSSPAAALPKNQTDPVVELSPFEVRADADVGYQAANTTSGSRLNSRLKDTPTPISAFTPEFLSDIAATNLQEMLGYAINVEGEFEDAVAGFSNPAGRDSMAGDYQFRMRGMNAGAARDFVESGAPTDLYNVERAEVASGPNSILFGLGQAGGLVALSGKKAGLNRDRTTLKSQFGTWDYKRYEADYNKVIFPKLLSLRLLGLYQNSLGWRKYDFNDQKRFTGAVTVQPFKHTTINASYENGRSANSTQLVANAADQFSRWNASGRPVADGAAVPGTNRLSTTTDRFTFSENDGKTYNLKGELQSSSLFSPPTLSAREVSPYDFSPTGPGGQRHQKFSSHQALVQQRLTRDLVLELAYFHNEADIATDGMNVSTGGIDLRGDPNLTLPATDGSTATVANPRARQLFMESTWVKDRLITKNDIVRLSSAWDLDLGKWFGRHRVAGLLENSQQDRLKRWKNEILVDQNNRPITNANNPETAVNMFFRRNYFEEGDYGSYYGGNGEIPLPSFTYNGRQISNTYVSRTKANQHALKDINTYMLASQSFWFRERLVTTLGYRIDKITFNNAVEGRVNDPNDPRVLSRQVVLNEWDFNGETEIDHYSPKTFTYGAVLHAHKRLSLFYNRAINNGSPRFDRTILPEGKVPPPTDGRSTEKGVMIDLFGDDRFFLRATFFDTAQLNDAPIVPNGTAANNTTDLGGTNLIAILDALLAAGKISPSTYDQQAVSYNAATIDLFTKGVEVEFVANPTRNLTMRFNYSHSERRRENFFEEVFAFYNPKYPEWQALAASNPALKVTVDTEIAALQGKLQDLLDKQNAPFGTRPHKANFTTRYKFTEGRLRGVFGGGGVRYQGKNFLSTDKASGHTYWGNETVFGDAFAGYRTRLPGTKIPLSLQLNVKNISNSYLVGIGRYNDNYTGIKRIYLNEPRSYRLTTTLEF